MMMISAIKDTKKKKTTHKKSKRRRRELTFKLPLLPPPLSSSCLCTPKALCISTFLSLP